MQRRRLLQFTAIGVVGAPWRQSDAAQISDSDGSSSSEDLLIQSADFDPAIHGFGFSNWEGNTGTDTGGEEFTYEPSDVTLEDVRQAIDDSWTIALSEAQKAIMMRIVYSWIGGGAATNGHCYGMMFAADYYFHDPSQLPDSVDVASDIPRPTGRYNAVGDRIRRFQTSQLLRAEVYWFALFGLRWGFADHRESLSQLTDAIDATGTGGLAISSEEYTHQVLAHEYERGDGVTNVFVYDPTYEAAEHENPDDIWTLSVDQESGEVYEIEDGYEEFLYHDPEMDLSVLDGLIGGHDRVLDALANAVFLGLETGSTLEVDAPEDVLVDRPAAEYANWDSTPYADAAVVLGSVDTFTISIDSANGGEYSLDTLGIRNGDLALEEDVSGTLDELPAQLRFSIDEAGEFIVDGVEDIEADAETAAEEVEEDFEGASDGGDWIEDNWWVVAAGGALGLGAAYRFLTHQSDD